MKLNKEQQIALDSSARYVLVLAGAGTGKTTVMASKAVSILESGQCYDSNILAITFTNKAADEIKIRLRKLIGIERTKSIWIGTFHAIATRIIRKHNGANFSILSESEAMNIMMQVCNGFRSEIRSILGYGIENEIFHYIQKIKDKLYDTENFADFAKDAKYELIHKIYCSYQLKLKTIKAMDFGDLLLELVLLLKSNSDICSYYRNKFKYILVDEYQDISFSQYVILRLLLNKQNNYLFCVGDDDQTIYEWRGAKLNNILQFQNNFPESTVVKLNHNYRSTFHILETANNLIKNNNYRYNKSLSTDSKEGEKVKLHVFEDDKHEAHGLSTLIASKLIDNEHDVAILVRNNNQMPLIEEYLNLNGIKYNFIGESRFYEKKEIKDALAYIELLLDNNNDMAFSRIINVPKRGIGVSTINKIKEISAYHNCSLFEAAKKMQITNILNFTQSIETLGLCLNGNIKNDIEIVKKLLHDSGYLKYEQNKSIDSFIDNLSSLKNLRQYSNVIRCESVTLGTIHSSKGTEYNLVFLPGWEEGILPSLRNNNSLEGTSEASIEEERRLAYVAITRAKYEVHISYAHRRRMYGPYAYTQASRFIDELSTKHYQLFNHK